MSLYTGKEFKEKYPDTTFIKLTIEDENHNGFQFKDGENIDTSSFTPSGQCNGGGIYFCKLDQIINWLIYGNKKMHYFASYSSLILFILTAIYSSTIDRSSQSN
jgi:hypothetical protein